MNNTEILQKIIEPCCLATTIGSLPHADVKEGTALMLESTPEIPSWIQFPKRIYYENMMVQFTEGLPGLKEENERFFFDTKAPDFVSQLTDFYFRYLEAAENNNPAALDYFGISSGYAAGFSEFLSRLPEHMSSNDVLMLKGQATGPFTMGINLADKDGRCSYYNKELRDVIVKTITLKAKWQMTRMSAFGLPMMIFLDEPSLLNFGSQLYLSVSREDVTKDINEVTAMIHSHGALAGVHCEENTDWSLLMESDLDILDFDAYDHAQAIALYPEELGAFLERGGWLGWGIVPTLDREAAGTETVSSLLASFETGVGILADKGIDREILLRRALITPSCGAGGILTEDLAERALGLLRELSVTLRKRYGFI